MSKALTELKAHLEQMQRYNQVITLLYWDMRTAVPKEGYEGHAKAVSYFSGEQFALSTSEKLGAILDELAKPEEYGELDETWKFIVSKMKKEFDRNKRVPKDFFESFVKAKAESQQAWRQAKAASDYSIFAPHLEKMIEMTKEMTGYTDPGKDVYDTLLDRFEAGMDSKAIDALFGELKQGLIPLVQKILKAKQPDELIFTGTYEIESQRRVQDLLLKYIGFRFDAGTVGETEHPFTMGFSSKDVRVTNHYYEDRCIGAMYSAIHEGGHAMFEQNVNPAYDGTPAGSCEYMGVHESQSRFYENILGRNKNFWVPIYGQVQELLPKLKEISLDEFYREANHVKNSPIRIHADELTYCFHIILRYEMELAIFRGHTAVEELPALWNQKMQEYLQITPANDAEGILQDIHWSEGSFGYFPSYLLGSIYDGMYLDAIQEELGDVDTLLSEGRISEITKWLNEKIHWYGNTRTAKDVLKAVCKKEASAEPLIRHFKKKYTELYSLEA